MSKRDPYDLAERIRAAVRAQGMTTYALARDAGIDRAIAVRFMSRERGLNLTTASRICRLLKLTLQPADKPKQKGARRG